MTIWGIKYNDLMLRVIRNVHGRQASILRNWNDHLQVGKMVLRAIAILMGLAFASQVAWAEQELPVSPLTIQTKSTTVTFQVELADTPAARQRGLMYRESLDRDQGMLFDYQVDKPIAMWMKNTLVPLDMLFISNEGRIVRIEHDTEPLSLEIIPSGAPVRAVLELLGGTAAWYGIEIGDKVLHAIFTESAANAVSGEATVVDGDTIQIAGRILNLFNIDAPELDQECRNAENERYPCGQRARYELSMITAGREVSCDGDKTDREGRLSAICYAGTINLSQEMVARGWALVFRLQKFDEDYIKTEKLARKLGNGIWQGTFITPWDWRAGMRD